VQVGEATGKLDDVFLGFIMQNVHGRLTESVLCDIVTWFEMNFCGAKNELYQSLDSCRPNYGVRYLVQHLRALQRHLNTLRPPSVWQPFTGHHRAHVQGS
jgi:hypothetical protein